MSFKLYMTLLCTAIALNGIDCLSRMEQRTGIQFFFVNIANALLFLLGLFSASVWLLYVHYRTFRDEESLKKLMVPLAIVNGLNLLLIVVSQFTGCIYSFDSNHIYHRGKFFILPEVMMTGIVLISTLFILCNLNKIERRYISSLLIFPVPSLFGLLVQVFEPTMPLALSGETIALLVVFSNIQKKSIDVDYLTELYNRREFDVYLRKKINAVTPEKTFSAILLDLDCFKAINDQWGHVTGDHALRSAAHVLRHALGPKAFIARYGGDEFCAILDVSDAVTLQKCAESIQKKLAKFNDSKQHFYIISLSMGCQVYDYAAHPSEEEFLKEIDNLMYRNKRETKAQREPNRKSR